MEGITWREGKEERDGEFEGTWVLGDTMKDDMLPEYNLDGKKGMRGKYAKVMKNAYSVRVLKEDTLTLLHEGREERDAQIMLAVMGEDHFRHIALEKGVDWDALTNEKQMEFVRECFM